MRQTIRNARYNAGGSVDVEFLWQGRWVWFTADPNDEAVTTAELLLELQRRQTVEGLEIAAYEPPDPTPEEALDAERAAMSCSRFQAKVVLEEAGLLASAEAAVQTLSSRQRMAWTDQDRFTRMSPTIIEVADILDLSPTQVDDLFRQAATIAV
ncbi:MAG: hypothetical protein AAGI09_11860 [Pseudomonadota bacterium]